ncbi:PAS domain S-box protein [Sphingomonas sp. NIBR02145]|uniref:PAS domain S-box protein n=1 Tax=Sphingomonas sp. NIBR02145 TaxID=3014784 RepID=UPI0022B4AEE7|nr:PAS domain S-box protein [Sphingomonas sp. NIBR02145]WHU03527.1 PAS domain S-box protein [Sphingomonas sp. NIBR02145]
MAGAPSTSARDLAAAYGLAVGSVVVATLLRWALEPWLNGHGHYLLYAVAVLVTGAFAGSGPALAAALASVAAVALMGWASGEAAILERVVFLFACSVIILVVSYIMRLQWRLRASEQVAERRANRAHDLAETLNLLIDGAEGYGIYMLDPDGRITIWNKAAERLKGWSEREVVGRHCSIFYPDTALALDKPQHDLDRARAEGCLEEEDWCVRKNGSEFLAHTMLTPLYDEQGALRGFAKVVRDVTEQRAAERHLQASAAQFRSILAAVPDAMVVINETGKILSFSAAAEKLFGVCEADVVGSNVSRLMPAPDRDRHDDYLRRYLETGEARMIGVGGIVLGQRHDGTTFPMDLSVGEATSEGGRVFIGFIRDLTEKVADEERIEALRSELVHAARVSAMGTMASTLAHELNQPITAVVTFVRGARNMLRDGNAEDRETIEEGLDEAFEEALRAGSIVRRLREFVARGEVEKSIEALSALVEDASELALIGARERGVEASFRLDLSVDSVLVDRIQIQQVLINLMRNAIEAMIGAPRRSLTISTAPDDPGFVRVTVADTGPGVPPGIAENLFRAFHSTKSSGMGLGLSICRTIVEANGGRIWLEPDSGDGARFHFTLVRADAESLE